MGKTYKDNRRDFTKTENRKQKSFRQIKENRKQRKDFKNFSQFIKEGYGEYDDLEQ